VKLRGKTKSLVHSMCLAQGLWGPHLGLRRCRIKPLAGDLLFSVSLERPFTSAMSSPASAEPYRWGRAKLYSRGGKEEEYYLIKHPGDKRRAGAIHRGPLHRTQRGAGNEEDLVYAIHKRKG